MKTPLKIAAIILAAGASTRMGTAKQLLVWKGKTLIKHSIDNAIEAGLSPVVVVLGANAERIQEQLNQDGIYIAENKDWPTGMGSSVATGIEKTLQLQPDLDAICFLLTDQPFVDSNIIRSMVKHLKPGKFLGIAARYNETLGVPAIFGTSLFAELAELRGKKGAKSLLIKYAHELDAFDFPKGEIDMDYPEDWETFKKNQPQ